ncbi:MAG: type II toxin-antitoxin system Phd/YefM family antitoxin [Acetobacter syzygii]|uniref:type II toxin-antitoxin system Phd/YefM family antitoxin n=1 Tax=Acetobacter syzygii TaxID=146476 RepID=UPI002430E7EC|nr:type II toxin-antitoxin system Phd/YefM family antitoxin [Acetobacter syzygii]
MAIWQVQEAKAHLSEVIEAARMDGPQTITRHGTEKAVLLSMDDYRALVGKRADFKSWLLSGPKVSEFEVSRDSDIGRVVDL